MTLPFGPRISLSYVELGTVARFAAGDNPFAVPAPEPGSRPARAALDALRARGLVREEADGTVPGDKLQQLLDIATAADGALVVTSSMAASSRSITWLTCQTAALEQCWDEHGLFHVQALAPGLVAERARELALGDGARADGAAAEADEIAVDLSTLAEALEGREGSEESPVLIAEFAAAVARGVRQCSVDRRQSTGQEIGGVRFDWLDAGAAGLWELDAQDDRVVVRRLALQQVLDEVDSILES